MANIFITPEAEVDLLNLWVYIARDNPATADLIYQTTQTIFETLEVMPNIDNPYRSKRSRLKGIRFFPINLFRNYIIYYRKNTEGIEIIRVLPAHVKKHKRIIHPFKMEPLLV